ncbi:type IV toxin-antitoxin system AbiEi family antitoxin domain-containing protein [Sporichthya sp.]|uniref:type IV toxin-antitoxin system AbiEi family antitoxin domain-containing protein n=1 Tax=Sporichthya sp. TaxID=65475 RepID=UPI0017D2BF4D|nr:type IV toxin-antitoxin system AbiEi family antitoxin domain-containing protein [Sporichthya sp.]MBA3741509.1 type IV toxin-antitoxin system AbiEi family antitoxin domain-containing protein [Sporichthya sp.]
MSRPPADLSAALSDLPGTFTLAEAAEAGLSRHGLYRLLDEGELMALRRGLYRRTDAAPVDLDLITAARAAPRATLCLATALAHHGLSDAIPAAPDIALPRGTRAPAGAHAQWHFFAPETFDLGRGTLVLEVGTAIGLYSPQRCIIDAFRTRRTEGHELAIDALKEWLRQRGSQPSELMAFAAHWPRVLAPLRSALAILL